MSFLGLTSENTPELLIQVLELKLCINIISVCEESLATTAIVERNTSKRNSLAGMSFDKIPHFDGVEKNFTDFEFRFGQFVCATHHFKETLTWAKDLHEEPSELALQEREQEERMTEPGADSGWVNSQPYFLNVQK